MDEEFVIRACVSVVTVVFAWLCVDFYRLPKSPNLSLYDSVRLYVIKNYRYCIGWYHYFCILRLSRRFNKEQERFLLQQLRKCSNTEYGREMEFSKIHSIPEYFQRHPLTTYEDFQKFVVRMTRGERNLLTPDDVTMFCSSSGTTGECKYIPAVSKYFDKYNFNNAVYAYLPTRKFGHSMRSLSPIFRVFFPPKYEILPGSGKEYGPVSGRLGLFREGWPITTLPTESILSGLQEKEMMYIHLLFALRERGVAKLESTFATSLLVLFNLLEERWPFLVQDIKDGCLASSITIPDETRKIVNKYLRADSIRAQELKAEFERGFAGIAGRIWPELKVIYAITSGSFQVYKEQLMAGYARGVQIYSPWFVASEVLYGYNMWMDEHSESEYLLLPDAAFWEFIPFDQCEEHNPTTLTADQVVVGEQYEIVLTNLSGFYRYRTGDVVLVSRRVNQAPAVQVLFRRGQLLSVRGEKTSEKQLYSSLTSAATRCGGAVVTDFACAESPLFYKLADKVASNTPHYVIFVEMKIKEEDWSNNFENALEEELCKSAPRYKHYRTSGGLGRLRVFIVNEGTFLMLRHFRLSTTKASSNQIKVARLLTSAPLINFLLKEVRLPQESAAL